LGQQHITAPFGEEAGLLPSPRRLRQRRRILLLQQHPAAHLRSSVLVSCIVGGPGQRQRGIGGPFSAALPQPALLV
jgi:hypothetical protein